MKSIGVTLQRIYLTKNCKKKKTLCDIQLSSLTSLEKLNETEMLQVSVS